MKILRTSIDSRIKEKCLRKKLQVQLILRLRLYTGNVWVLYWVCWFFGACVYILCVFFQFEYYGVFEKQNPNRILKYINYSRPIIPGWPQAEYHSKRQSISVWVGWGWGSLAKKLWTTPDNLSRLYIASDFDPHTYLSWRLGGVP